MWELERRRLEPLVLTALLAAACGSPSPAPYSPTAPTTTSVRLPVVQASVATAPLEAKRRLAAGMHTYEIAATITLRETAGVPGRIDIIDATFASPAGFSSEQRFEITVEIDEFSMATVPVRQEFTSSTRIDAGVWRLAGTGTSDDGDGFVVASVEVPVMVKDTTPLSAPSPPVPAAADVTIAAAGDIAPCGSAGTEGTARLLDRIDGTVLTLGDNVYPKASAQTFRDCYDPTWGRHKSRTRSSPGNHDWEEADFGASYFAYFGFGAGPPGLGYHSFNLGAWHIVSLNSSVPAGQGSAQLEWLRMDLAANTAPCTLAYWHYPLFTSGPNGPQSQVREIWRVLYERGVDVVLNGHDHNYERFALQDPDGRPSTRGIRQFVVGTGGAPLYYRRNFSPMTEVYDSTSWGVLKMTLRGLAYDWEFVPAAGGSFRDSGSAACVY